MPEEPNFRATHSRFYRYWPDIRNAAPELNRERVREEAEKLTITFEEYHISEFHVTPARRKRQLKNLMDNMYHVIKAITEIERDNVTLWGELGNEQLSSLRDRLKEVRDRGDRLRHPPGRGGGGEQAYLDRLKKESTAEATYGLLDEVGRRPTLDDQVEWIKLTKILFKIVDGQEPGDVTRACSEIMGNRRD
jgi:hypothetical protein